MSSSSSDETKNAIGNNNPRITPDRLKKYWTLIGADMICSLKRCMRYLELKPEDDWTDFGYVHWGDERYSKEQVQQFVNSPDFSAMFETFLAISDKVIEESKRYREEQEQEQTKRRKTEQDEVQRQRLALLQITPEERRLQLRMMTNTDLKRLYCDVPSNGNKEKLVDRILEHEINKHYLKPSNP